MNLVEVPIDDLVVSPELMRIKPSKAFASRLRASIEEIGLAEPLKTCLQPGGGYLVIDGYLRLDVLRELHRTDSQRFAAVPTYVFPYEHRFELRLQSDIYQDLLPSQLASLVEHLHAAEGVRKSDIARFIGVSPATLRNYTGLARLMERGGLFADVVRLMDAGIFPSSNPYAWLRLKGGGLHRVLFEHFTEGADPSHWIDDVIHKVHNGQILRYPATYIENVTSSLPADCYRAGEEARLVKRDLGLRKGVAVPHNLSLKGRRRVEFVANESRDPVLQAAATYLRDFLK